MSNSTSELSSERLPSPHRGRDTFVSSGRGGLGNMHCTSASGSPGPTSPDVSSQRTASRSAGPRAVSSGRGGLGNIRSRSGDTRDVNSVDSKARAEYEHAVRKHYEESKDVKSTGRGGAGNIFSRSRSRPRSSTRSASHSPAGSPTSSLSPPHGHPPAQLHSTGRGGLGNIIHGPTDEGGAHSVEDDVRLRVAHAHAEGMHSTGRGGAGNITALPSPPVEHHAHAHFAGDAAHAHAPALESFGRGGAGNMRSRSQSRARADDTDQAPNRVQEERRSPARGDEGAGERHGARELLHQLTHPQTHAHKLQEGAAAVSV